MNIFTKFEMNVGNYNLLTFMPTFNSLMLKKCNEDPINYPSPIEIITYSNPPELTNVITFVCQKPFILNMNESTMAETLGFSTNIRKEDDNIKYNPLFTFLDGNHLIVISFIFFLSIY
jgi:hypothetical protein